MEWSDVRVFLAVARSGALGGAARSLQTSHPTVSRRLRALEQAIGHTLFQRTADGLVLTDEGQGIVALAEQKEERALAMERRLAGQEQNLKGSLRISSADWVGAYVGRVAVVSMPAIRSWAMSLPLTGRGDQAERPAERLGSGVDLGAQASARPTQALGICPPFGFACPGRVLVGAPDGRIDHQPFQIGCAGERRQHLVQHTHFDPAIVAPLHGRVVAQPLRQIPPVPAERATAAHPGPSGCLYAVRVCLACRQARSP
jgi:DNA-binding transcriptional LysR family regulator